MRTDTPHAGSFVCCAVGLIFAGLLSNALFPPSSAAAESSAPIYAQMAYPPYLPGTTCFDGYLIKVVHHTRLGETIRQHGRTVHCVPL